MAGNNRNTVWNMDTARGIARRLCGAMAVLAVAAWSQFAVAQGTARLTAVEVLPMQGSTLQVRLRTDGTAPQPLTFTIDKPARLSVDLPDVGLALENRRIDVGAGGVDTIVAAEATGRTRVVFNLESLVSYTAVAEGDSVLVTIGGQAGAHTASSAPNLAVAPSASRAITGVDFRRSPEGAGRVVVQLSDPTIPASVKQEGNRVIVDFTGAALGEELMKRYDVVDFATPVTTFDATRFGNSTRIIVTASGDFEQLAYQTDNQYVIEVRQRAARHGRGRGEGQGLHGRAPDAQLPGHRRAPGAAAPRRHQRAEHRGVRLGQGPRDAAPAERPLGPGARHRAEDQGPRHAPQGQRDPGRPAEPSWRPRKRPSSRRRRTSRNWRRCAPSSSRSTTPRRPRSRASSSRRAAARCSPSAATSRSTSAPTRCSSRTRRRTSRRSAAWSRRSTSRSARC